MNGYITELHGVQFKSLPGKFFDKGFSSVSSTEAKSSATTNLKIMARWILDPCRRYR